MRELNEISQVPFGAARRRKAVSCMLKTAMISKLLFKEKEI